MTLQDSVFLALFIWAILAIGWIAWLFAALERYTHGVRILLGDIEPTEGEEEMEFTLPLGFKTPIVGKTKAGVVVPLENIAADIADPAIVEVVVVDGKSYLRGLVEGLTAVSLVADARIGEGVRNIQKLYTVTVAPAEAADIELGELEPEE